MTLARQIASELFLGSCVSRSVSQLYGAVCLVISRAMGKHS